MATLRKRILLGAVLWSFGLVVVVSVILANLFEHHPEAIAVHDALTNHPVSLGLAFLALLVGFLVIGRGLSPIGRLRERLGAVHRGEEKRVVGHYPAEVQPLVDDLNALLTQQEQAVQRAAAKAGDLAHGLKTPLAILRQEADRASAAGHTDLAAAIAQQVERMRRQIDYQLAHARATATGNIRGVHASVADSAEALVRTVQHLYAERRLQITSDVSRANEARVPGEDLDEMLGNLLDNACKWAKSQVVVRSSASGGRIIVDVEDDGAGLDAALRDAVLQRGVRADEAAPGTGLGLSIVRDLAEAYRGRVSLDASSLGGLRARLELPESG